jgi:hypothetical protein
MNSRERTTIPKHNGAIESETKLRAVPGDELGNTVGPLFTRGRQAVQDGRLWLVRDRGGPGRAWAASSYGISTLASATASFTVADNLAPSALIGTYRSAH